VGDGEHAQAGEVDGGGEQGEVGGDLGAAADPGTATAVAAAHQVPDFAFHLGPGAPVVGNPARITLPGAGRGKLPRWLMAVAFIVCLGITLSTIALRFHYGVDDIAGFIWIFPISLLARASLPREKAELPSAPRRTTLLKDQSQGMAT